MYIHYIKLTGVCEPMDSSTCEGKNSFVDCSDSGKFDCPVINEAGRLDNINFISGVKDWIC